MIKKSVTIKITDNTQRIRFYDRTGARRSETFHNVKLADRRYKKLRKDILGGKHPPGAATIQNLLTHLKAGFFPTHSPKYNVNISSALIALEFHVNKRLDKITKADIELYQADRMDNGIQPSTINQWATFCHAACAKAIDYGLISGNPFKDIRDIKEDKRPIYVITKDEESALYESCTSTRDRLIVSLALYGGMRAGEIAGFNIRIDITEDYTIIARAPKTGDVRTVEIPDKHIGDLKRFATARLKKYKPYPFYNRNGTAVSNRFIRIKKKTHVPCRLHDLRETCSTRLARMGMNAWRLKEYMGHADIKTTQKYYIGPMGSAPGIWDEISRPV